MYFVQTMYPRIESSSFDLDHYVNVHVPMGLGLLWKHRNVKPMRDILYYDTFGMDRRHESAPYHVIATMHLKTEADATQFIELFEIPDVAAMLRDDWSKFTDANPIAVCGKMRDLDVDDILQRSGEVLEAAAGGNV